jgi:putative transposase
LPLAANILNRQFEPNALNKVWVVDMTYTSPHGDVGCRGGFVFQTCCWLDHADRMTNRLVVVALNTAIQRRIANEGILPHLYRGFQYASDYHQRLLEKPRITCSMSGIGKCWDNTPMESFFEKG